MSLMAIRKAASSLPSHFKGCTSRETEKPVFGPVSLKNILPNRESALGIPKGAE
ncbi:MAG: hypothetical protein NTW28_03580 [Candidatus Solibacter sp.]|nr:hypothetical protein [Candidatus Solibacter sp.]